MSNSLQIAAEHLLRPQQRRLSPLRWREPAPKEYPTGNEEESGARTRAVHRKVLQRIYGSSPASEARQSVLRPGAPYPNEKVLVDASMALLIGRRKRLERHQRQQDLEEILFEINRQSVEAECVAKQKRLDDVVLKSPVARRKLAESAIELLTFQSYHSEPQLRLEDAKQALQIATHDPAPSSSAAPSSFTHTDLSATPPPDVNSSWFNGTFSTARSSSLGQLTRPSQGDGALHTAGTDPLMTTLDAGGGFPITDWQGDMPTHFERAHVSVMETVDHRSLVLQERESGWNVSVLPEKPIAHIYAKKRLPLPQEETTQLPHVEEVLRAIKEQGVSAAEPRTATSQAVCALFTYGEPQPRSWRLNVVAPILSRVTDPPKPKSYREILEEKILSGEIDLSDPEIRSSVMTLFPPEAPAHVSRRPPPQPAKRRPEKQANLARPLLPLRSASAPLAEGSTPLDATSGRPVSSSAYAPSADSESPKSTPSPDRRADDGQSNTREGHNTGEPSAISPFVPAKVVESLKESIDAAEEDGVTAAKPHSIEPGLPSRAVERPKPTTRKAEQSAKRAAAVTQSKVRPNNCPPATSQMAAESAEVPKEEDEAAAGTAAPQTLNSAVEPQPVTVTVVEPQNVGAATKGPSTAGVSVASKKPKDPLPPPPPARGVGAKAAPTTRGPHAAIKGKAGNVPVSTKLSAAAAATAMQPTAKPVAPPATATDEGSPLAVTAASSTMSAPSTIGPTQEESNDGIVPPVEPSGAAQNTGSRSEAARPESLSPTSSAPADGETTKASTVPPPSEDPASSEVQPTSTEASSLQQLLPPQERVPTRGSEQQYSDDDFTDGESSPPKGAPVEQSMLTHETLAAPDAPTEYPTEFAAVETSPSRPPSAEDEDNYEDEFDAQPEEASDPQFQDIGKANEEYSSDEEEAHVGEAEGSLAVSTSHTAGGAHAPTTTASAAADVVFAEPPLEQQEGDAYANALSAALRKAKKRKDSDAAAAGTTDVLAPTVLPPPAEYLEAMSGATSRSVSAEPQARPDSKHRRFSRGATAESRPQYTARDFFSVASGEPNGDSSARGSAATAPDLASYFAARPTSRASTDNKGRTPTAQTPTSDAPTYEWSRSTPPPDSDDGEAGAGDVPRRRKKSSKKSRKTKDSGTEVVPAVLTDGFEEIDVGFPSKPQKHRHSHKEKSKRLSDVQPSNERETSRGGRRGPSSGPGLDL